MRKMHSDIRGTGAFEAHKRSRGGDPRQRRPWMFLMDDPFRTERHRRKSARLAALPGKHLREVKEPVRSTHGKQ